MFISDRSCNACGCVYEATLASRAAHDEPHECPDCGSMETQREAFASAPLAVTVVPGNSDYSARQGERLAKRSDDHFKKRGDHEGGRSQAIENQRAQWKREGLLP